MKTQKERTIVLENLTIGYKVKGGDQSVATNIAASVFGGELTCLLGANGVGKSTLLRTMTAHQPILGGEIYYHGAPLSSYNSKVLSSIISIVLTDKIMIKNIRVFDLVGFGRSPYTGFWGTMSAEDCAIIEESLELVGITKLANRMAHTLSDGERQKVMIAKALAQQTPIILLDEPTAFLDFPSKVEMMHLLHKLSRTTGKTIFLSTHDLDLALQIADRIWLMDGANGINVGTSEDLALNGSLSRFFERKGIQFNRETGLFYVENSLNQRVQLQGEGILFQMVRKALMRNGMEVSTTAEGSEFSITIEQSDIVIVARDGAESRVQTIDDLLNIVVS
ncbi:MAG: ABC transporter ATP-binding protein [Rikenellaceae bacterium]